MKLIEHTPKKWTEFIRTRNPISESIVPVNSQNGRQWSAINASCILTHAKWAIKDLGVHGRGELQKADKGLYIALMRRKLLDEIGLGLLRRGWSAMSDEELIGFARKFIAENGIEERNKLKGKDQGLYTALYKRKLMSRVGLSLRRREWSAMSDGELVGFARSFIAEMELTGRMELEEADTGLYEVLRRRKLLDRIGLEEKQMCWAGMEDEELVGFAKKFIKERGVEGRRELQNVDSRLFLALKRRKLLNEICLKRRRIGWNRMDDEELVGFAKKFIKEREIHGRRELEKERGGLLNALRKRGLLDEIGLERKYRTWAAVDDEELVRIAKKLIEERGMRRRVELQKEDGMLYATLRERDLLDDIGLEAQLKNWSSMDDVDLVKFATSFIAENGIDGRSEVAVICPGLYGALRKRRLLNEIGLTVRRRNWTARSDEEILGIARRLIIEFDVEGRSSLKKKDSGLYRVLYQRNLLDDVFSDIEHQEHKDAVLGVLDALESFGDS